MWVKGLGAVGTQGKGFTFDHGVWGGGIQDLEGSRVNCENCMRERGRPAVQQGGRDSLSEQGCGLPCPVPSQRRRKVQVSSLHRPPALQAICSILSHICLYFITLELYMTRHSLPERTLLSISNPPATFSANWPFAHPAAFSGEQAASSDLSFRRFRVCWGGFSGCYRRDLNPPPKALAFELQRHTKSHSYVQHFEQ